MSTFPSGGRAPSWSEGVALLERGAFAESAALLDRVAASLPRGAAERSRVHAWSAQARADHARVLVHGHRYAEAERALDHALARDPAHAELRWLRARIYERSGRPRAALGELEVLAAAGHRSAPAALLEAACRAALGDVRGAAAAIASAVSIVARVPSGVEGASAPWRMWGGPEVRGARDRVRARLEHAVAAAPGDPEPRWALAELLLDSGAPAAAAPHLDVAASRAPGGLEGARLGARAALERGEPADAVRILEAALAGRDAHADLAFAAGLACERAGALAEARGWFERALGRNRRYALAWQALAIVHFRSGDAAAAAHVARQATVRHRERPAVSGLVLRVLARDPDAATLRLVRRNAALHPDYPDFQDALARAEARATAPVRSLLPWRRVRAGAA